MLLMRIGKENRRLRHELHYSLIFTQLGNFLSVSFYQYVTVLSGFMPSR